MDKWWVVVGAALVTGALLGSFLCLVIERFPSDADGRNWLARICRPPSACNHCGEKLTMRELVPLFSWMLLRGRCCRCGQRISGYCCYIELLTALMLAALATAVHRPALFFGLSLFSCAALVLCEVDRRHLLLPDVLTLPLLWCGLLFNLQFSPHHLPQAILGSMAGYLCLWILYWLYRLIRRHEGMGLGDAKYLAAIGAWCGLSALPLVVTLASGITIAGWLTGKFRGKNTIQQPFGPGLTIAGWSVLIAQHKEHDWFSFLL